MAVRLAFVFLLVSLAARTALAQGGGIILYENGSPDMGSSYAGAGARAQDAATAFTNPAGMAHLEGNQILLGTMAVLTDFALDLDSGTVSVPPGSTDGGGELDQFAPGLGSYGVISLNEQFKIGFAINALAANGVEYDRSWVGRTFVIENQFVAANIQPAVSYRVNDWLSVGAGINLVYMSLDQQLLASNAVGAPTIEIDDADDWQVGGTFGGLFELNEKTRIGLTYRTELEFDLSGEIDLPLPLTLDFDTELALPQGVNASVFHQLTDTFALLGDVGWSDWSTLDKMPTTVGPFAGTIERDWDDTWRVGIGIQWEFNESWTLRSGFGYDSSPVDDDKRLPDIPVGEQYRISFGIQHDFGEGKRFGASYTLMYSPMDVDDVALPGGVVLNGEYDPAFIHIFGMTFSIAF
ncbi:MAG: OmpP1/FadL family transporter [Planctomycetota bacterium]|jgi:long-chain fatty acid transport protein